MKSSQNDSNTKLTLVYSDESLYNLRSKQKKRAKELFFDFKVYMVSTIITYLFSKRVIETI
jgi:hypothetical protein